MICLFWAGDTDKGSKIVIGILDPSVALDRDPPMTDQN